MRQFLGLIIGLAILTTEAAADLLKYRPVNYFSEVWSKDPEVCSTVLRSLNQQYLIPEELYGVLNPTFYVDLLLTSELQVEWSHGPFDRYGSDLSRWDYTYVDLANDGHEIPVVRYDFTSRASGSANLLFLPPTMPDELRSTRPTIEFVRSRLAPFSLYTDRKLFDYFPIDKFPMNGSFEFNILKVVDKTYLLGASAMDVGRVVWEGGHFDAYVIEYRSPQRLSLICLLQGG